MPLVSPGDMLLDAQKHMYAVGAFNVENMEMALAVISTAERLGVPAMLQTTPSTIRHSGLEPLSGMIRAAAQDAAVPIALHLDHGNSFALAARVIRTGYTSVMIDASHQPFEENIAITRSVVEMAQPNRIPVEAELGRVGGKEDDLESGDVYTDPILAEEFARRTGITSLAVAIGTAHGFYDKPPALDIGRLREIRARVDVPLVLHGASGLTAQQLSACIREGICKVNFATELRVAFSDGVKEYLTEHPNAYDPKSYGGHGRHMVEKLVEDRIEICGCRA